MRMKIILLIAIILTACACKSPMSPDLAKEIEEEEPTAQILLIPGKTTISYWFLRAQIGLREVKGVECRVTNASMTVSYNGNPETSYSYTGGGGHVDIGTGIVPANGYLTVYFQAQLPMYSQPRTILIKVWLRDAYGHELEVYDIILWS